MGKPLDLHAIIVNRNREDASFPGQHDLLGRRIPWFLKPDVIAARERCTHDEAKRVRGSRCDEDVLRGTAKAARSSKVGSKLCPQRLVPIRGAIPGGCQTS